MCYDYNEPYCRKDQCDRESTAVKNLIWNFVDVRHNLFRTTDILFGLQSANGMKNTKMGVAKTNKYLPVLTEKLYQI